MRNDVVEWIKSIKSTHTLLEVFNELIKNGFTKEAVKDELIHVFGLKDVEILYVTLEKEIREFYPQVDSKNRNQIIIDGRVCNVLLEMKHPRVVLIDNFLSDQECWELIRDADKVLDRSTVINRDTGLSKVDDVRTSSGMFFQRGETPLIKEIEERISLLTNWPIENQEGTQILKYDFAEQYKPLNDYFETGTQSTELLLKRGGQRLGTVIIYLNTCGEGGGTIFPETGLEIKPTKGCALFFSYPSTDKSSKTTHGGLPVLDGQKYIAVKWLRENEFN